MSKGAGGIGARYVRTAVVRAIGRIGGVGNAQAGREGMRAESLAYWRFRFAGKSAKEVTHLAQHMPRVKVAIYLERGRQRVVLEDGRHRLQAAREVGAKRIAVEARIVGERGSSSSTYRGVVRI